MFKKLLAVLLVTGALVSFAACGDEDTKKPNADAPKNDTPVETPTAPDADVEDIDLDDYLSNETYEGYNYRILVRKGNLKSQYFEEPEEDIVNNAIYNRNKAVEERYGITITASESSHGNYETDALNSILAGDDAYDIVFAHSRAAFAYAVQGAAYNIHDIESIHVDMPWWSKNINENCTVNGRLYVLDGDISVSGLSMAMCLVFNKRIFDEKGYDYPYELVRDHEWTFDEFAYLSKKGSADLNGDGVMKPEDDQFGFVTGEWSAPINILYAGNQKIFGINDEGRVELTLYSNKTVEIFDEFFSLMNNEANFLQFTEGNINYNGPGIFSSGRAMFEAGSLGSAQGFRSMDDDFGMLPYPVFDEEDEYATAVNGAAPLIIIPISVSDVERTGAITEALAAYGSKYVIPAFYDVSLKTKYARDDESEEMMDIIKDSIIYDMGYVAGGSFQSVGRDLSKTTTHDFSSFYAAREASAKSYIEEFNRDYGGFED